MRPIVVSVSDASGGAQYSNWVRFDDWAPNYISIQCVVTGTVDYTIEYTLDDPNSPWDPVAVNNVTWAETDDADVVNSTVDATSNFIFAPTFARVKLNSGSGSVRATFLQSFGGV
jgi:hypothetical protein